MGSGWPHTESLEVCSSSQRDKPLRQREQSSAQSHSLRPAEIGCTTHETSSHNCDEHRSASGGCSTGPEPPLFQAIPGHFLGAFEQVEPALGELEWLLGLGVGIFNGVILERFSYLPGAQEQRRMLNWGVCV